jgi:sugar phosphate isomerase/epimerase
MIDRVFAAPKGDSLEEGIAFAGSQGLGYELQLPLYPVDSEVMQAETQRFREFFSEFAGPLALHGPYEDLNVASLDPDIARISRQRYLQAIDLAKALNVRYLIFHSQWNPLHAAKYATKAWLSRMTDFWEEILAEHFEGTQTVVLIENFLEPVPEYIVKLLSRVNSSQLKACLDIGHTNLFSQCSPLDWVRELGPHVAYIQAHNNGGELDSHDAFDKGTIDMASFLNHIALLPQKLNLSIETASLGALESSYIALLPYLKLQTEQAQSKSFLI